MRLENFLPVELDVGVVLFDPPDGFFVERRPPNLHAWRRAEPVQNSLPCPPALARCVDERRGFVPALIAGEPQKWQDYLRFEERPDGFAAARCLAGLAGLADLAFAPLVAFRAGFGLGLGFDFGFDVSDFLVPAAATPMVLAPGVLGPAMPVPVIPLLGLAAACTCLRPSAGAL